LDAINRDQLFDSPNNNVLDAIPSKKNKKYRRHVYFRHGMPST